MNANELRIGSWVKYSNDNIWLDSVKGEPYQIRVEDFSFMDNINKYYSPIPLTEKILLDCDMNLVKTGLIIGYESQIGFLRPYQDGCYGLYRNLDRNDERHLMKIEYVHELQNIFYDFTKTELDVKL